MVAAAFVTSALFALPAPARAEASVSVLCYHAFLDKKKDQFCFSIDELNAQIQQIKKEGFTFVSVYDVLNGKISGNKNVLVTVDDGNKSVYEAYMKVFRPNGIRPLLAIYPNVINRQHYALTWEQLGQLANMGCDIAAHGFFHLKINQKLHDKNPRYFNKEIYESKKVLEEKLGRKINIFVYPFGLRSDITIRTLRDAGYRYAFTIENGRLDVPVSKMKNALELPRYMVTRTSWKFCFNRVMKNGRGGSAVTVARSDEPRKEHAGTTMLYRPERPDPVAELQNGLMENTGKVLAKKSSVTRPPRLKEKHNGKKKLEKQDTITPLVTESQKSGVNKTVSGKAEVSKTKVRRVKEEHKRLSGDEPTFDFKSDPGRSGMAPIRPVMSDVKREPLPREISGTSPSDDRTYRRRVIEPDSLADAGPERVNQGKMDILTKVKGGREVTVGYYSKLKKKYYSLTDETYRTYNDYFSMIRDKVDRFKHTVRGYIIKNF